MRVFAICLLAALVLLQYRLWVSDEGVREVLQLRSAVEAQRDENAGLVERNGQLKAEVADLKGGLTALEERARHDLGMVAPGETFYQVVNPEDLPPAKPAAAPATRQAAAAPAAP
ncbi:MAG: cell division protein FtsB [Steroidobacteraceae bacterium]|jgi:cell division protein FtsB|nr:cell division protein FtsB [Steroidobacteraceae bacterium]